MHERYPVEAILSLPVADAHDAPVLRVRERSNPLLRLPARPDQTRLTTLRTGLSRVFGGKSQSPLLQKGKDMGIIAFIILGALAGVIAKAIMPGNDPGGFIVTTIIGIVGALLGGFLAAALFDAHPLDEFFDISTWLTAIIGSIILLALYRVITNRKDGRAVRA